MNPDPNPNPNPNRNNPNNLLDTINLIRYNVRIGPLAPDQKNTLRNFLLSFV